MCYRVKNYVSLNKTSLTHRAHSICLGTDINKCLVSNGGCSHYCKNWGSSYVCTCPAGYEVDSSDKNCIGNKMTVFNNSFSIFGSRFVYFFSSSCCIFTLPADCSSSSSILACPRKVLHESSKIFSEHSLHFARKQSRNRALYNRARGTAGSVMTIGLPLNGCLHSKNQFDERKQDWLVQKLGCGDFKGLRRFLMPV